MLRRRVLNVSLCIYYWPFLLGVPTSITLKEWGGSQIILDILRVFLVWFLSKIFWRCVIFPVQLKKKKSINNREWDQSIYCQYFFFSTVGIGIVTCYINILLGVVGHSLYCFLKQLFWDVIHILSLYLLKYTIHVLVYSWSCAAIFKIEFRTYLSLLLQITPLLAFTVIFSNPPAPWRPWIYFLSL